MTHSYIFLEEHDTYYFIISEKHTPNEPSQFLLDDISTEQNICITYTNNEHNITIYNPLSLHQEIIVNPTFFELHKEKISKYFKNKINESLNNIKPLTPNFIYIPDFLINDELINEFITNNKFVDRAIYFYNVTGTNLTEEQINKLKSNHLNVTHNGIKISTNKLIGYRTLKDLQKDKDISISHTLTNEEIENFIYINDEAIITINKSNNTSGLDEQEYLNNLIRICNILKTHNKKYNIQININNRKLLKQSRILNTPNINFTIDNDLYEYKQDEYLKEEEQLDKLIEPIKNANLSPYEKYLAVYNIVKQFKSYKENNDNKEEARNLRYILNNEYIVCVGFAKLLTTLLDKIGIPAMNISAKVDTSYDKGFTMEDIPTHTEGHQRNLIKIDDDKYNIHGIFIADATWDNDIQNDLYLHSSMTFAKIKEAHRLETLQDYDLLLDFNNFEDFTKKLNFFLKKQVRDTLIKEKPYQYKLTQAYLTAYKEIMKILSKLDYQKFLELYNKYDTQINKYNISLKEIEDISSEFLTEYAKYILPLSNQKIDNQALYDAITNIKKEINNQKEDNINDTLNQIKQIHSEDESIVFPYEYDPQNEIPNYLTPKNNTQKR